MIDLGSKVKDMITGFTGIAIARTEWLYGCTRIVIESQELKDGKPVAPSWFDEQRVEEITPVDETKIPVSKPRCGVGIQLGNKVKDSITGFAGVAVAKTIWISGNVTIQIEATALEKSEPIDGHAFEYERIELVEEAKPPMSAKSDPSKPGGPQKDPVQRNTVAIK